MYNLNLYGSRDRAWAAVFIQNIVILLVDCFCYCKVTNFRMVLNFVLSYFEKVKKVRNLIPDENLFLS